MILDGAFLLNSCISTMQCLDECSGKERTEYCFGHVYVIHFTILQKQ